jgi:outer membrane protein assembly factor BamA
VLAGGGAPLPPQLRLFGGGPRGVRGVGVNLLGPRILLARDSAAVACDDVASCAPLDPDDVYVRGAGGDLLAEASVEARLWATRGVQLAAFVDAGAVRTRGEPGSPLAARTEAVVTPGVGGLALTPAGPIRLDVAYNPSPVRTYPLLVRGADGGYRLLGLLPYDPFAYDDPDAWTRFRRRLRFQLSMGTPF